MGFFRFTLAALVMLSHLPGTSYRTNYGQMAVLGFYFISGYLMALMYTRFMAKSPNPTKDFFLDRVFKLWPSYLLVLVVCFLFYNPTDIRPAQLSQMWPELLMLPNAYTKLLDFSDHYLLIPQTWSLGV
jgi:peptidoglycan/LPS O-acetylase OafA/YrhL